MTISTWNMVPITFIMQHFMLEVFSLLVQVVFFSSSIYSYQGLPPLLHSTVKMSLKIYFLGCIFCLHLTRNTEKEREEWHVTKVPFWSQTMPLRSMRSSHSTTKMLQNVYFITEFGAIIGSLSGFFYSTGTWPTIHRANTANLAECLVGYSCEVTHL